MGRQVEIIGTQEDLLELMRFAARKGARAVTRGVPLDDPPDLHDPAELFASAPESQLYLLPADLAAVEIVARELHDQRDAARVYERLSPVVELTPPFWDEGALRAGRLYVGLETSSSLYEYVKALYQQLLDFTSDWPRAKELGVRVGPQIAERARSGEVAIQSGIGEPLVLPT